MVDAAADDDCHGYYVNYDDSYDYDSDEDDIVSISKIITLNELF